MINQIQLLRNIGQFKEVNGSGIPAFDKLTLIYAENGRGKTTLASILRSLGTGNPVHIAERTRLGTRQNPHIVIDCIGGPPVATFENNAWNRLLPCISIFDDVFVEENIFSGLSVESEHRQNINELIIGAQGIRLNSEMQRHVAQIEVHNAALRTKGALIPAVERGAFGVDDFCALPVIADIDAAILAAERNLTAARQQDNVRNAQLFQMLDLPTIDPDEIDALLQRGLPAVEAESATAVQAHLATLGAGGGDWVSVGLSRIDQRTTCPFCAQDISSSALIGYYRVFFGDAYRSLKQGVATAVSETDRLHGSTATSQFERSVRVWDQQRIFWSQFSEVPAIALDTAAVEVSWRAARDAALVALRAKLAAPLDAQRLPNATREVINAYNIHRQAVRDLSARLQVVNAALRIVQEQAAAGNQAALAGDIARLKATRSRHSTATAALCTDYLAEKTAKTATEALRDAAKVALCQYQTTVYPAYNAEINEYLRRFNAGFRIENISSVNTRAGTSCTYNILINASHIAVAGGTPAPGAPSFRNTLSSGDRNSLALAFFFTSIDRDPALADRIIVIDDPMTSLDEHRALTTAQEVRRLTERVAQVIVLSHNKPFLCRVWEYTNRIPRTSLVVARDGDGSTLHTWNITEDSITEYDRRHALLRQHQAGVALNIREVAQAIRPVLEGYLRIACPEHFPPGRLLGQFRNLCQQRLTNGGAQQVLTQTDTDELRAIIEYGNLFHHDTNPAWQTATINDGELRGFVDRTMAFVAFS